MEQVPNSQKHKGNIAGYLWLLSICIGLPIGAGFGSAIDNIGAGIGIGLVVGVTVGIALYRLYKSNSNDDQNPNGESHSSNE